jgi:hypothetical protein
MIFYKVYDDDLKYVMNWVDMKKNSNFKLFKVIKFTFKTIFNHVLLSIKKKTQFK